MNEFYLESMRAFYKPDADILTKEYYFTDDSSKINITIEKGNFFVDLDFTDIHFPEVIGIEKTIDELLARVKTMEDIYENL